MSCLMYNEIQSSCNVSLLTVDDYNNFYIIRKRQKRQVEKIVNFSEILVCL